MSGFFWVAFAVLWVLVCVQGLALLEVLRQIGLLRGFVGPEAGPLLMRGSVPVGEPLPELRGRSAADGHERLLSEYLDRDPAVIVFLTTRCVLCRTLAAELTTYASRAQRSVGLLAVVQGDFDEARRFVADTDLNPKWVLIDEQSESANRLNVQFAPAAVGIVRGQLSEAAVTNNLSHLDAFIERQLAAARSTESPSEDGSAPAVMVRAGSGREVTT